MMIEDAGNAEYLVGTPLTISAFLRNRKNSPFVLDNLSPTASFLFVKLGEAEDFLACLCADLGRNHRLMQRYEYPTPIGDLPAS